MKQLVTMSVNGDLYEIAVAGHQRLIDVIRDVIGLTGTKEGCGEGECGACTVIMDGRPVNSCLVLGAQADGAEIITIEGLMVDGGMSLIQSNFVDLGAVQCGFCSPGMILTAKALLDENPEPSEEDVREALAGNLCRCTGYDKIVDAVLATAATMRGGDAQRAGGLVAGSAGGEA